MLQKMLPFTQKIPNKRALSVCDFSVGLVFTDFTCIGAGWHLGSILASRPAAQGSILGILKIYFDVAERLEESGQRLNSVDQTDLVQASTTINIISI